MNGLRRWLALAFTLAVSGSLVGGEVVLPSDVSVSLSAEPSIDLRPGQLVAFTISVTNHGPESVGAFAILSSAIYDELDVFDGSSECDGSLGLAVADLGDSFYYLYYWYPIGVDSDESLAVGETRTCHLNLPYTQYAPAEFPVTFALPRGFVDPDPGNNSATVILRRAVTPAAAIPALSPPILALLALLLAAAVGLTLSPRRWRR